MSEGHSAAVLAPLSIERFPGMSHGQALAADVPEVRMLVTDLVGAGSIGVIAAVPESYKSLLAMEIACKIACGGKVLGRREVTQTGPVAYWWQDDNEADSLARIQAYSKIHNVPGDAPIRWHINEGLRIPEDIPAIRAEVERYGQKFMVLDSLYNFLRDIELKSEEVAFVFDRLKDEVCHPTGCTIAVIDHQSWPNENNRGQARGYGSVFKTAAIRWGIYLKPTKDGTIITARGNNMRRTKPTLARFSQEHLELRIADQDDDAHEELDARVWAWLAQHPDKAKSAVEEAVTGRREAIRDSLVRLQEAGRVVGRLPDGRPAAPGESGRVTYTATNSAQPSQEFSPQQLGATSPDETPDIEVAPSSPSL